MILRYQNYIFIIILINVIKINSKAWRQHGGGGNNRHAEIWPLAMSSPENGLLPDDINANSDDLIGDLNPIVTPSGDEDDLSAFNLERRSRSLGGKKYFKYEVSKEKPIYILFPLPKERGIPEHNPFGITIDLVRPVIDVALSEVYRRQLIPEGVLKINFEDTRLSDAHGPNVAIHALVKNQLDCIIGYAFVYALAPVARMSPHWEDDNSHGIPIITSIGLTANLDNRKEYQLMTRISSPYKVIKDAVLALFNKVKWRRTVYLFHDRRHGMTSPDIPYGECYLMMASLEPYLSRLHRMEHNYFMFNEQLHNRVQIQDHLKKASTMSNVIILCASPDTVREIMLSAHDLGMATSGEYVFINIDVSTGSHAEKPWIRANDTNSPENEKAKVAYKALKTISLRRSDLEEYKNFESRVKERAENKYSYSAKTGKEYEMNNFISAFYDAVLLYAIALNETLAEGLDPRNGRNITSKMWNRTFVGITGNVSIDQNGDRYSDYSLLDLDETQGKFMEVAYYSGAQNALRQVSDFHWVKGSPPKDSPICGWDHSKCPEGYPFYYYALFAAFVVILLLLAGVLLFYRRYKLESELAAMSWKIRWEELEGDDVARKEKKKKRARKTDFYNHPDQSVPFLRSNSRTSNNSDKRSSSSGATRKISAMIDRKFSIFTRKKSSPTGEKALENNHNYDDRNNINSPSNSNSNSQKKKSSAEDEFENNAKKSLSLKNRKLSFYSIRSGGSVETIQMQNNAQIFTTTSTYRVGSLDFLIGINM